MFGKPHSQVWRESLAANEAIASRGAGSVTSLSHPRTTCQPAGTPTLSRPDAHAPGAVIAGGHTRHSQSRDPDRHQHHERLAHTICTSQRRPQVHRRANNPAVADSARPSPSQSANVFCNSGAARLRPSSGQLSRAWMARSWACNMSRCDASAGSARRNLAAWIAAPTSPRRS